MAYLDAIAAHETHAGYFSVDKKGKMTNGRVGDRREGTSDDADAYDLNGSWKRVVVKNCEAGWDGKWTLSHQRAARERVILSPDF